MDIQSITEFLEIANVKNYSEAAENLYTSQSALSKHIMALEKELGIELFDRTTRKISLSEVGKIFLPYAQNMVSVYHDMKNNINCFKGVYRSKLKIGCFPTMAYYGVMNTICDFKKKNAGMTVDLIEYNGKSISNALKDGEFDLAFSDRVNFNSDGFESQDFCKDHLVAIVNKTHPLSAYKIIDLHQLEKEPLIFMDNTTPLYNLSYYLFKNANIEPNVIFSGIRIENTLEMVEQNMGIAILPKRHTSKTKSNNFVVCELKPTANRTIAIFRSINNKHSHSAKSFWNFMLNS